MDKAKETISGSTRLGLGDCILRCLCPKWILSARALRIQSYRLTFCREGLGGRASEQSGLTRLELRERGRQAYEERSPLVLFSTSKSNNIISSSQTGLPSSETLGRTILLAAK